MSNEKTFLNFFKFNVRYIVSALGKVKILVKELLKRQSFFIGGLVTSRKSRKYITIASIVYLLLL